MKNRVNQLSAAFSLSKFSLLATLKSPTSIVFSLLFPIIFIIVFGTVVGPQVPTMKLAIAPASDTDNVIYSAIKKVSLVKLQTGTTAATQKEDLAKGRISGILSITKDSIPAPYPHYTIHLTHPAAAETNGLINTLLHAAVNGINDKMFPNAPSVAGFEVQETSGRIYRNIDFILPGQLGFSLLMAGVYGSSFLLFNLRQSLVLKRLRVAPVRRRTIIGGEMLSRLLFHVISFIIMVALGYYAFQFTLINGFATFLEMLAFSLLGLIIFMGIGFIISGMVQNENSIAPIANTVVLPQLLLCGLFFPIENYPHWLQQFCNLLPLTFFVDGLRKIAFEGAHIWQIPGTVAGLLVWNIIIAPLAIISFKWE